jgi:hypothetical protein
VVEEVGLRVVEEVGLRVVEEVGLRVVEEVGLRVVEEDVKDPQECSLRDVNRDSASRIQNPSQLANQIDGAAKSQPLWFRAKPYQSRLTSSHAMSHLT